MEKISVIIPMYNAEAYIEQCIRSVQRQTCQDLEIVVVDDGSTDNSLDLCDKMSREDPRIKVFAQENSGVSRARNHGLDVARGEYLFFLDSDDGIHPLLFEEMLGQAEGRQAEMVFCDCALLEDSRMEERLEAPYTEADRPLWQCAEGEEAEEWFHIKYVRELSRICGLVHRDCIGDLRFDETLKTGEDTLFKYRLFCRQVRTAYSPCRWYYYRTHAGSAIHAAAMAGDLQYCRAARILREEELQKGRIRYAMTWENLIVWQIMKNYSLLHGTDDRRGRRQLKAMAASEGREPSFSRLAFSTRVLYRCCFACYPLYLVLDRAAGILVGWRNGQNG